MNPPVAIIISPITFCRDISSRMNMNTPMALTSMVTI